MTSFSSEIKLLLMTTTTATLDTIKEDPMVELTGTEKQVAWATKIRDEAIQNYRRLAENNGIPVNEEALSQAVDLVTDAARWIEHGKRRMTISMLFTAFEQWIAAAETDEEQDRRDILYGKLVRPI